MKTVSLEQEINPWEAQSARFNYAAQKLNLDEGLWKVLQYPNRELIVHIPVSMDNGKLEVFPKAAYYSLFDRSKETIAA